MKRFTSQIVLWAAFALFPVAVQGQWIDDYHGFLADGDVATLNVDGVGDARASYRTMFDKNVYVGPYVGSFSGVTAPSFSIICVDFFADANGQQVLATSIGSGAAEGGLTKTRLGKAEELAGSLDRYRQAAYYASLFDSWESLGSNRQTVWTDLHAQIWTIMTDHDFGTGETTFGETHLLAALEYEADGWYVLTGTGDNPGQEMLVRTRTATVPEPSTYLLMATGLFFLAVLGRKRRDQVEA